MYDYNRSSQLIPPSGGYRELHVYDGTMAFCDRFISKRSHTHDRMVQEVRCGKEDHVRGMISRCFNPGSGLLQA